MSLPLMTQSQQSIDAAWALSEGRAIRIAAQGAVRWLRVLEGRVWLTHTARQWKDVPLDCWLLAGDCMALPAGQDAVLEAWPTARFELLQAAPRRVQFDPWLLRRPWAVMRRWGQRLRPSAAPWAF